MQYKQIGINKTFFVACIETSRGRVLWLFQGLFSLIYIVNCSDNVLTLCTDNYIAIKATRLLVLIMYRNCRNDYFIEFSSCTAFTHIYNLVAAGLLKFISLMVSLNLKKPFLSSSFPAQALSQWEFRTKRTLSNSSHKTFLNQSELCFWAGKEADWKGFFES